MEHNTVWIDFDTMERFMVDTFKAVGVPEMDAAVCADVLIAADKRGIDSHGVNRLKPIYIDRINAGIQLPTTEFEVVRESMTTAVIDGHHGMGQVIAKRAMQMCIDKAKTCGMGMVTVRNSTHYGIAGYYPLMAVENGMIGIAGTNARPSIAPTFGVENMMGTNPLTWAMPTDEDFPFFLDCATSISQRGKVEVYAREGKPMPEGWVIRNDGTTPTDAQQTLTDLVEGTAAFLPLGGAGEDTGGYKGYGYALVVEILSAALQGGNYMKALLGWKDGKRVPYGLGHFFMAMDITAFTELQEFKAATGDMLRTLRASQKAPGCDRIYTPGEKEHDAWLYRKNKGVPLNAALQAEIKTLVKDYAITGYDFPFV